MFNLFQIWCELLIWKEESPCIWQVYKLLLGSSDSLEDFCHFRCLIYLYYNKLSFCPRTQDNMKSLLSYIVSYYLRHFDEVSDDIYLPPSMKTHFSLNSDYLPSQIHCDILWLYISLSSSLSLCLCVFSPECWKRDMCVSSTWTSWPVSGITDEIWGLPERPGQT